MLRLTNPSDSRLAELREKRSRLLAELDDLTNKSHDAGTVSDGLRERADNIQRGLSKIDDEIADRQDAERSRVAAGLGGFTVEAGSAGAESVDGARFGGGVVDTARRTLAAVHQRSGVPTAALERAETLLTAAESRSRSTAAAWVAATGSEDYEQAFLKLLADPTRGHLLWTDREADAYRQVEHFRAMSLTDASGGYMVPFQLDPAVMLTSDGSINPIRQIARVVTATGDVWNGVSSAGASAEWIAEATEVADGSPTLDQPSVPVHKYDCFVPFSFEIGMDGAQFMEEMRRVMADSVDQLQATAFTTGSGTGQPTGVVTALTGTSSVVTSAGTDAFAAADVYSTQEALGPRFQPRAQWAANLAVINLIDQFETTNGSKMFPQVGEGTLLRKPLHECSNLDGSITALADNYLLVYGDWSNYVIADRIGTTLELVPHLFGANSRPTGQRGALLWGRVGADAVVDESFTVLNVT